MNITRDGWIQWAIKDPGPADRWAEFGNARTPVDAIYHHSFEGWFNPVSESGYNVMDDPERYPTAWHGTVTSRPVKFKGVTHRPGTLFQHYPINARLQHANAGNVIGPGFELEGMAGTPITDEQIVTYRAIHRDIAEWRGKPFTRNTSGRAGLCEHREAPGAQTNCPNHRYDRLWAAIAAGFEPVKEEESQMTDDQIRAIVKGEMLEGVNAVLARTERLNYAIQLRNAITAIALDPDMAIVEQAAKALKGVGFKL